MMNETEPRVPVLQPCPNEECRGECRVDTAEFSRAWQVFCERNCGYSGPVAANATEAIELHNRMPRTEPWVSVAERMPEDGARVDLVFAKNPDCEVDEDYTVTTDPELMHERGFVPLDSVAPCYTHWRPHTPPRGPVAK